MKIHQLIDQLQEYDPDADVVVTKGLNEYYIESLDIDNGDVCIEVSEDDSI